MGKIHASPYGQKLTKEQRDALFALSDLWFDGSKEPTTEAVAEVAGLGKSQADAALASLAFMSPYLATRTWRMNHWRIDQAGIDLVKRLRADR